MSDGLVAHDLVVRFGGLVAVDGVGFEVPAGRLTGLLGPNGAGKTTTFNACTGLVRPTRGTVQLSGSDITSRGPAERARLGIGRTFQRIALWERMTVAENVAMGCEARMTGARRLGLVLATSHERTAVARQRDEAIALCGIGALRDRAVGVLTTGQRRLVELARAIAGGFTVLLLDEPSSGLDLHETELVGSILKTLTGRGVAVLLVEHDMALVRSVCDYAYVLEFGCLIAEGATADVLGSERVRAAYLGAGAA